MQEFPFEFSEEGEEQDAINFHFEGVEIDFPSPDSYISWIVQVIEIENRALQSLNFIFCNDDYLHQINLEYLNHDTYTDVITFPYSQPPIIEGDIYISTERIAENAIQFKTSFDNELRRVMIHGVLHLCGYADKTMQETQLMRQKEEDALELWSNSLSDEA